MFKIQKTSMMFFSIAIAWSSLSFAQQQGVYNLSGMLNSLFGNLPAEQEAQVSPTEAGQRYRVSNAQLACPENANRTQQDVLDFTVSTRQLPMLMLNFEQIRSRIQVISQNDRLSQIRLNINDLNRIEVPAENLIPVEEYRTSDIHHVQDSRSTIRNLLDVDNMLAYAADAAYDVISNDSLTNLQVGISQRNGVPHQDLAARYRIQKIYADAYTGFKAIAFESIQRNLPKHRIYAIAGTFVFFRPDLRTWASGLSLGRLGSLSDASLELVEDAAMYAASRDGGEVIVTGQSQGGILAQNTGFLVQMRLNAEKEQRRLDQTKLVHIITLGAVGSVEAIEKFIKQSLEGNVRGISVDIERHIKYLNVERYSRILATWRKIESAWRTLRPDPVQIREFVFNEAKKMRVIGYFFQLDLFARSGTFLGTTYLLPYELAFPRQCDRLQAFDILSNMKASRAFVFETHFLNGYRRAMQRGVLSLARPMLPKKWDWVLNLQRVLDPVSDLWMNTLFLEQTAATQENWNECKKSKSWTTMRNRYCTQEFHPGCSQVPYSQGSSDFNSWCLIRER